jgi:hypothetical protein
MAQFQDLIGSIIIGGIILLMLIAFNGNVIEGAATQTFKGIVDGNLTTITDILENDFRKMGYRVAAVQDSAVLYADSGRIMFKGDINDDGIMDTVQYYIDTVNSSLTANPNDKVLHRKINSQSALAMYVGMIGFRIQYFTRTDSLIKSNPVPAPSAIKSVKVSLNIQSTQRIFDTRRSAYIESPFNDTSYAGACWERTIKSQNVR